MQIGIDIGGSHIGVGLITDEKIIAKKETDISKKDIETEEKIKKMIIATIKKSIDEIVCKENVTIARVDKKSLFRFVKKHRKIKKDDSYRTIDLIGIAIPGTIKNNKVYRVNNLKIKEFDIIKELKKVYDVPMQIRNDGKCAALCEKKLGNLKNYRDGIFLCIGTGIGSGVILDNELLESNKFPGFELGHTVIQKGGRECACGNKGCFEAYGSMKRLKKDVSDILDIGNITGEEINYFIEKFIFNIKNKFKISKEQIEKFEKRLEDTNDKDKKIEEAKTLLNEYVENMCVGLNNIINIFEPEVICFGGSMVYYENSILKAIDLKLKKDLLTFNRSTPKLVIAKYNNQAGIIGSIIKL